MYYIDQHTEFLSQNQKQSEDSAMMLAGLTEHKYWEFLHTYVSQTWIELRDNP